MKKKENNNFRGCYINGIITGQYANINDAISKNLYDTVMPFDKEKIYLIIPAYLKDFNQKIINDLTIQEVFNAFIKIKNSIINSQALLPITHRVSPLGSQNHIYLQGKYAIMNNRDSMFLLEAKGIEKPKAFLMFSDGEIAEDISDNLNILNDRALFYLFIWHTGPFFVKELLSYKKDLDFIVSNNKVLATEFREAFGGN